MAFMELGRSHNSTSSDVPRSDDWIAAGRCGFDLSQLEFVQSLTPLERLCRHESARQLVLALKPAESRIDADFVGPAE